VRTAPNGSVKVASVLTGCVDVAGTAEWYVASNETWGLLGSTCGLH